MKRGLFFIFANDTIKIANKTAPGPLIKSGEHTFSRPVFKFINKNPLFICLLLLFAEGVFFCFRFWLKASLPIADRRSPEPFPENRWVFAGYSFNIQQYTTSWHPAKKHRRVLLSPVTQGDGNRQNMKQLSYLIWAGNCWARISGSMN